MSASTPLGRGVGVLVGDLGEIAEGLDLVLRDALAALVHEAELPERHRLAGGRGGLERGDLVGPRDAAAGAIEGTGHGLRRVDRRLGA